MSDAAPFHVSFEVPGEPRGKGRPRATIRAGHVAVYTDAKTRSEEGAIRMIASAAMRGRPPYEGAVSLYMVAYRSIPASFSKAKRKAALRGELFPTSRPDFDNYSKMADALNEIVWRDDSQVVRAKVLKLYSDRPRLVIEVRAM
jgi:Holliday junction resolvase RusA-like endonuclease